MAASASAGPTPEQGMLLIANAEMRGSWFAEAVILLVQHDASGTVGIIVNRRTDARPADLLPEIEELARLQSGLYIGGPVEAHGLLMLVRSEGPPADAEHVFGNVYVSGSQPLLRQLLSRADSADRVRLYAGYAGWVPGQLDAEIGRGSWTVIPATESAVFATDPNDVWQRLRPPARRLIVRRDAAIRIAGAHR